MKNNITKPTGEPYKEILDSLDFFMEPSSTKTSLDVKQFSDNQYAKKMISMSYEQVKGTILEKDWLDMQSARSGSISQDERNAVQKAADEFYDSGIIGAAAASAADLLPGIPFVDIIDPPEELSSDEMQTARNILTNAGMVATFGGGGKAVAQKSVGRVATNLRTPSGYGGSFAPILEDLAFVQKIQKVNRGYGLERFQAKSKLGILAESIIKDNPIYIVHHAGGRELPYRKMFNLKPRFSNSIYNKVGKQLYEFNPKDRTGQALIREVLDPHRSDYHRIMGRYKRTPIRSLHKGERNLVGWNYEDRWDFDFNKGDVLRSLTDSFDPGESIEAKNIPHTLLRAFVNLITDPITIKGKAYK